jgi:membrane protein implicated in regulation of membrane protease activity
VDVATSYAWIVWLVLILVFVIVEMLTIYFVFLMLAIGSVAGLVSGLFGAPWWLQAIIAAVISVLLIFTIRPPLLRALNRGGDPAKSNVQALIGMGGQVVSTVTPTGGRVKLAVGETWTSRVEPGSRTIEPGENVVVLYIEGATAVVVPVEGNEL